MTSSRMNRRKLLLVSGCLAAAALCSAPAAWAQAVFTGGTKGVAINGYDPVGYFNQGKAVAGDAGITHSWNGVEWRFASVANRDAFAANPQKFAPQYGGYCAYAAASGSLVKTDPDAFTIHQGKLYLNYDKPVKRRWDKKRGAFINQANANWPRLEAEAAKR